MNFSNKINNYTPEGRKFIHENIKGISTNEFSYLVENPIDNKSIEYNDNRISLFSAQMGECRILGIRLAVNDFHCHHIKTINDGSNDKYKNLVIFHPDIHQLVHASETEAIYQLLEKLELSSKQIAKVNQFRLKVGNFMI